MSSKLLKHYYYTFNNYYTFKIKQFVRKLKYPVLSVKMFFGRVSKFRQLRVSTLDAVESRASSHYYVCRLKF